MLGSALKTSKLAMTEMKNIKSVLLQGNLANDDFLLYRPFNSEFKKPKCFIKVADISYSVLPPLDISVLCSLSCNFVTSQKYSSKQELIVYEQPLQSLLLKTGRNNIRFGKIHD